MAKVVKKPAKIKVTKSVTPKKKVSPPSKKARGGTKVGGRTLGVKVPRKREKKNVPTGVNFAEGSDAYTVFLAMLEGGDSRTDVTHKLQEAFAGVTTRGGQPKPVTTIMNTVLNRALGSGYVIESSWKLVPADGTEPATVIRPKAGTKKSSTVDSKPASKPKKVAKPVVAKKKMVKRRTS